MKILVTGSTGFVGQALMQVLINREDQLFTLARRVNRNLPDKVHQIIHDSDSAPFSITFPEKFDVIIHLAGRAHILNEKVKDPLQEFRKVNVEGTLELAKQALENKVKRFIFISSIGVNGSSTNGKAFSEQDVPQPHADYAVSKLEAELALQKLFEGTETELVIIRPPLVYAAHAPGNFARLLKLASTNIPLPFIGVNNKRTFVALENLVNFIECCITHPLAKNELFLIADTESLSTKQLVTYLRQGMQKKANLIYIPHFVMKLGALGIGKIKLYEQLFGSLEVDSSKARTLLGWQPPLSAVSAIQKAGNEYTKVK
ncbi:NAD-dependent epimerase/dehydratase family protein [Acinetobacter baumannii]|uniref:NAD-dependent epimerase/dehydratase family protein n=1 Tax=Acinetobacter baumannii TaxID=470 RepID=A0AAP1QWL2_ACIBA|nr:NAD-dependent epimerase/dehydratase family protein [Acinetobacter baumannii]EHU1358822.1 NAD-dependent epimerase/dehydratase family protein [Acinetobacter baumannii]ELN8904297.1 NAD-dependent epimerase/dehydratase family protein [Acinetobacter baumannii]ELT0788675.1 NAD-dependent epimerase/dehydratase family protein [Acinetobacter baumannii]MBD2849741.1 NAD-dependent epimerase/dehydratase family protein [Acinetobacter baumannii]MBD3134018.1 NAD-dependent epimerase/dehydratase family protein